MAFTANIEVRFGDCDPAGIVYFPMLYHYCHIAFEMTWSGALGVPYPELVRDQRLGFPTVRVETDFASPARYGDTVSIDVSVPRIGNSSVDFLFIGAVGSRRAFRSIHTVVCTALDELTSRPIPEPLRASLAQLSS
jgi:4-hydroxybenzoyl-CoA thioesterase